MGSPTSLVSPLFAAAFELITFFSLPSISTLPTCSASFSSSPSSLSVSFFFFTRNLLSRTDRGPLSVVVSATLASPLPLRAIQEAREPVAELIVLGVPMNNQILDREATTDTESDVSLHILAREHKSFEEYVQEVRILPFFPSRELL